MQFTNKVEITLQNGKKMTAELYGKEAPITVENFLSLVKRNFYDGLIFHRVIKGFMIQGGDPEGRGTGGSGKNIKGEFSSNGVKNPIKHTRGTLSMARAMEPNSASSQFFIMHGNAPHLDGNYASFGRIVEGMDAVDEIACVETDRQDKPLEEQKIQSIRIIEAQ